MLPPLVFPGSCRKYTEKQALVVRTKKQAGQEGSQGCLIFVFILCPLVTSSALVLLKWMFHKHVFSNLLFLDNDLERIFRV
jgi:hypothetical protein